MAAGENFASPSATFSSIFLPPSHYARRLSSSFSEPLRPIVSIRCKLPCVRFNGGIFGSVEATSSLGVGKGFSPVEAVAWELFTPLQRVLIVAVIGVSTAASRKAWRITQLQRSIEIRDEELRNMQAKLDDFYEQMSLAKDQSLTSGCHFSLDNEHFVVREIEKENEGNFCRCGARVLHLNPESGIVPLCSSRSVKIKDVYMTEPSKEELFVNNHEFASEQEERRMSDLSDFCYSVASTADFHPVELSTLAAEQELYNLRNECEEKDVTIKELKAASHASSVAHSKRIAELEEVIRRKNMITRKLKKDILFLEQQICKLTRLRRKSSSSSSSSSSVAASTTKQLPFMTENILYDMSSTGSSSSSSSSDSDSPEKDNRVNAILLRNLEHSSRQDLTKPWSSFFSIEQSPISALEQNSLNRKVEPNTRAGQIQIEVKPVARRKQLVSVSSSLDNKKSRRRTLEEEEKMMISQKKWV